MIKKIKKGNKLSMKKIICLVFVLSLFCITSLNSSFESYIFSLSPVAQVSFYTNQKPLNFEGSCIQNGKGYIISTTAKLAQKQRYEISGCFGFSIELDKEKNLDKILSKIKVIKTETLSDKVLYYGQVKALPYSTIINGKKVNIQIAVVKSKIILGSPIILGSY